jgi:hypothetical protein
MRGAVDKQPVFSHLNHLPAYNTIQYAPNSMRLAPSGRGATEQLECGRIATGRQQRDCASARGSEAIQLRVIEGQETMVASLVLQWKIVLQE